MQIIPIVIKQCNPLLLLPRAGCENPAERLSDRHSTLSTHHDKQSPSTPNFRSLCSTPRPSSQNAPVHPANLKIISLNTVVPLPDSRASIPEDQPTIQTLSHPAPMWAKRGSRIDADAGIPIIKAGNGRHRASVLAYSLGQLMPRWKMWCLTFLNHRWFYSTMVILTFFTIFEDDVKHAAMPSYVDLPLEIVIATILTLFVLEMGEWG